MYSIRTTVLIGTLTCLAAMSGCATGTFNRLPEGGYEREPISTQEQKVADALRKEGATGAAREAQKRADSAEERERKNAAGTFFTDLLYMLLGIFVDKPASGRIPTP